MMKNTVTYYECHITLQNNEAEARLLVEQSAWKFSIIKGDPALGDKIFSYATNYFSKRNKTLEGVIQEMNLVATFYADNGLNVVRQKVEDVVYDTRESKVK